jgi:hypothetical protein
MNEKLVTLFWFLETTASIAALFVGIDFAAVGATQNNQIQLGGFSTLAVLGGVGLLASLIFGNTGPTLLALFKYPVMLIWWLAILFGSSIILSYGLVTLVQQKDGIKNEFDHFNIWTAVGVSAASVTALLALTLMLRSSIAISKFLLFH